MSLDDFYITKNDSLPSLTYVGSRAGSGSTTPNLTGATAYMKVRAAGGTTNKFTLTVTSSGGTPGQIVTPSCCEIRFDWSTDSWNSSGTYIGEISYDSTAGKTETALDRQYIIVKSEY